MNTVTTPEEFCWHLSQCKAYDGQKVQYQIKPEQVNYFSNLFERRNRRYASTKSFDTLANLQGGLGELAWGLYLCSH